MATKPVLAFVLSTDLTFGSGPAIGLVTKIIPPSLGQGFVPGTGVAAEHVNYLFNITGDWVTNWLLLGTSVNASNAHIVETDAAGLAGIARALVGGAFGGTTPSLDVIGPSAGSGAACRIANSNATTDPSLEVAGTNNGYGCTLSATGVRAPLRLVGRTEPSVSAAGDIYMDSSAQPRLHVFEAAWRTAWTTPDGFVRAYGEDLTQSSQSSTVPTTKVTAAFVVADGLRSGATVHIRAVAEVGFDSPSVDGVQLRVFDSTAAAVAIALRPVRVTAGGGESDGRYVILEGDYTIPADGSRNFQFQFQGNGIATAFIRNASIEVTGMYA